MLHRFDAWCQRNAWLLLGLLFLVEAAFHFWLSRDYWRLLDGCAGGTCSPETDRRIAFASLFARILTLLGGALVAAHLLRRLPIVQALPASVPLVARILVGCAIAMLSLVLLVFVQLGSLRSTALGIQYSAFAAAALLGAINLFPRWKQTA